MWLFTLNWTIYSNLLSEVSRRIQQMLPSKVWWQTKQCLKNWRKGSIQYMHFLLILSSKMPNNLSVSLFYARKGLSWCSMMRISQVTKSVCWGWLRRRRVGIIKWRDSSWSLRRRKRRWIGRLDWFRKYLRL